MAATATTIAPNVLAIIPARAGSKGVPGKNKAVVDGWPLCQYAMHLARQCSAITYTLVHTDDEDIIDLARAQGLGIRRRHAHMATDEAPVQQAIADGIAYAEATTGLSFDMILLLQPTSPLRTAADAAHIIDLLQQRTEADGVVSVVQVEDAHPGRMYTLPAGEEWLQPLQAQHEYANRQALPPVYLRNGCFYLARKKALLEQNTIIVKNKLAYLMDNRWELNIDSPRDLMLAQLMVPAWKQAMGWQA